MSSRRENTFFVYDETTFTTTNTLVSTGIIQGVAGNKENNDITNSS
jgi:hypothetical protein